MRRVAGGLCHFFLPVSNHGNYASNIIQLIFKIASTTILFFSAKMVTEGSLMVDQMVAFNTFAGR